MLAAHTRTNASTIDPKPIICMEAAIAIAIAIACILDICFVLLVNHVKKNISNSKTA